MNGRNTTAINTVIFMIMLIFVKKKIAAKAAKKRFFHVRNIRSIPIDAKVAFFLLLTKYILPITPIPPGPRNRNANPTK